ncbi:MAG: ABC transporter ATP-binding protein [Marinilabiliaceae bacterium]|nr:ABC transporter ATP-binding protein [Marinilabiliaceae bacterium]
MNTIDIQNITAGYDKRAVISDISLSGNIGDIVAIIGANGSGKSTLLRTIVGDIKPTSGNIFFSDINSYNITTRRRAQIVACVEQETQASQMHIYDYVMMGRTPFRSLFSLTDSDRDRETVTQAIDTVGITHLRNKALAETSGGERRLASIAKALAQQPKILLLDEPTANLDLANKVAIIDLLKTLARTMCIIIVSHDVNEVISVASKALILADGHSICFGDAHNVLTAQNLTKAYHTDICEISIDGKARIMMAKGLM